MNLFSSTLDDIALAPISFECRVQESIRMDGETADSGSTTDNAPSTTGSAESTTESASSATADAPSTTGTTPPAEGWATKRIDELTSKYRGEERARKEAETRAQLAEAAVEAMRKQLGGGGSATGATGATSTASATATTVTSTPIDPAATEAEIERRAQEKAKALADEQVAKEAFTAKTVAVAEAGKKAHQDFDQVVGNWKNLGGIPTELFEAAAETGVGHEILYALGKDLNLAMEVAKLPPVKLAMKIAAMAGDLKKPPSVSGAPEPIITVNANGSGAATSTAVSEKDSMESHYRKRMAARAARMRGAA